jgi:uncharacterized protein YebE (UPF0316 family)
MEMKLLILFVVMNVVNVVIQTIKSIATIKCGKTAAAIVNAVAYGLYTYIVVLTMCDLPLLAKCLIVAGANFVGVWVVKYFEEKARKDKLWKVEATVPADMVYPLHNTLKDFGIAHNYIEGVGQYTIFNIYCPTQKESNAVRELLESKNAKYFVSESKTL